MSPPARTRQLPAGLLLALAAALASLPLLASLPSTPLVLGLLHDFAHVPVFGSLALILRAAFARRPGLNHVSSSYWLAFITATLIGAGTELVQGMIGRDARVSDLLADAAGAASFLLLAAAFDPRLWRRSPEPRRPLLGLLGAGLLIATAIPLAHGALAHARRKQQFPVLFEARSALDLYYVGGSAYRSRTAEGLHVVLDQSRWPGITLREVEPDWRGYRELVVELINLGPLPLELTLRVHDRGHDHSYEDRFNRRHTFPPRARMEWRIPLAEIEAAPKGRRMEMNQVEGIVLFANGPQQPGADQLLVASIRLE